MQPAAHHPRVQAMRRRAAVLAWILALAPSHGAAEQAHASHRVPSIAQDVIEKPIGLRHGIGLTHGATATPAQHAAALTLQGTAYLHSYAWIDAARSFHAALRASGGLAAAHLGLSYAYEELNEPAAARAALDRARALAAAAPERDRTLVAIRSIQLASREPPAGRLAAYRAALDDALAAFPSDAELWLLRGMAASGDPVDRGQGATEASIPFFQRALTVSPGGFAAHHYLVHAYENTGRLGEALTHAERYAQLAPAVPHAHHMRAHGLRRLGRVNEAIAAMRTAYEIETDPARVGDVPPEYDWHHQHNLDLLGAAHQYIGQVRAAERFMRASFATPSPLVVQELNKHEWPAFLLAQGRADEALAAAAALKESPAAIARGVGHVMAGRALLALQRFADAADASNRALAALRAAGPGASLAAPYLQALQAEFYLRTGRRERARAEFRDVRRKIRALPGPDAWSHGLFRLESIGRAAVAAGAWDLAAETAADMHAHDPSYGGTHHLLALVAGQAGDRAAAVVALERAERAWRDADPDFAPLADVRARLGKARLVR